MLTYRRACSQLYGPFLLLHRYSGLHSNSSTAVSTVVELHAPLQSDFYCTCHYSRISIARATTVTFLLHVPLQSHFYCMCHYNRISIARATTVTFLLHVPLQSHFYCMCHYNHISIARATTIAFLLHVLLLVMCSYSTEMASKLV